MRKLIFILFLFSLTPVAEASIGRGCYVDGVLYTVNTSKGNRYFYRDQGVMMSDCGFEFIGGTSGDCRLFNGGNESKKNNYTLYPGAFGNKWEELECPLDNHVWILVLFSSLAVFKLKSKFYA